MSFTHPSRRYSGVAIALHWVIGLAIIAMIALGWFMSDLPREAAGKQALYQLHKSVGITILLLSVARILWRVMNPPPPLPESMKGWQTTLSHAVHIAFYALMILMPLSGWALVSGASSKVATVLFGAVSWPKLPFVGALGRDGHEAFEFLHSKLAWVAIGLLVLHVAGAIKHEIGAEEGVLKRMIPGLFGKTSTPMPPPKGFLVAFGSALALFAAIAAVPLLFAPAPAELPPSGAQTAGLAHAWRVDPDRSAIAFSGTLEGNPFAGRFGAWSGDIVFDPDNLAGARAEVTVDTGSAITGEKLYDDSLKQGEWFDIANFPTATVSLSNFAREGEGYRADAVIVIKGRAVSFPIGFTVAIDGDVASMSGKVALSRKALDLGMESDPGGDWVADSVEVDISVVATRAQ